ncbi:hypothetical protein M413DRAFT_65928 [Hebeloma cylindrosporum]|uniref:Protein-S-isoprenylcysteine O-methyltransferase n=1 Tax=Hebeloma cylindrosporum TaxID=76867 RepID=A0A0C2Y6A9_HEBCY|nr:hypothetical protein M413DRAFT_65928 [Hebeloma cylindrosporum h7]
MIGLQMGTTPPYPPPNPEENAASTSLEIILKQRSVAFIFRVICWSATLAEIAVILASQNPILPLSRKVLSRLGPGPGWREIRPTLSFFLGTLMTALGGYVRWACYRALGRLFTFEMSIRDNHELVTDGPYGWVRHPAYTGILLIVGGVVLWHATEGSWARECGVFQTNIGKAVAFAYVLLVTTINTGLISRMAMEDAALRMTFGPEWDDWAGRIRYKLIPLIY